MYRFYDKELIDEVLDAMEEVPEIYLAHSYGQTKSIPFNKLKEMLGIDQAKTLSKCDKAISNLCEDLAAALNIDIMFSKHSAWIWFNMYREYKGYRSDRVKQNKQKEIKEKEARQESIRDGTYGVNSKDVGGVYLLSCGDFYKIGRSIDVNKRLSSIRTSNPNKVELVTKYSSYYMSYDRLEKLLHEKFKHCRHNLEWFRKEFTEEDFIQACVEFCKSK